MEQIIDYGIVVGFDPNNQSFALITNGYYTIKVYVTAGTEVQIGKSYHVYKKGSMYHTGAEVTM
jgi:hypothetical protein